MSYGCGMDIKTQKLPCGGLYKPTSTYNGSVAKLALKRNFQISREPNEKRGGILGLKYADD